MALRFSVDLNARRAPTISYRGFLLRASKPRRTQSISMRSSQYTKRERVWQTATKTLIMAAESRRPLLHARIGVMGALNRNVERVFNPSRKDPHWGRRKLARDR
jgi:hypothetical protein